MSRYRSRSRRFFSRPLRLFRFEDRITPALTSTFDEQTGLLSVSSDAADSIIIGSDHVNYVTVNGTNFVTSTGLPLEAQRVRSIQVAGGPGNNLIDLSDVDPLHFAALYFNPKEISVDKSVPWQKAKVAGAHIFPGNGDDTVTGSHAGDYIEITQGNDVVHAGRGDNLITIQSEDISSITIEGSSFGHTTMLVHKKNSGGSGKVTNELDVGTGSQTISYAGQTIKATAVRRTIFREGFEDYEYLVTDSTGTASAGEVGIYSEPGSNTGTVELKGSDGKKHFEVTAGWQAQNLKYTAKSSLPGWQWNVDSSHVPSTIALTGPANTVTVNRFGHSSTVTTDGVQVAGKAPVTVTGALTINTESRLYNEAALIDLKSRGVTITPTITQLPDGTFEAGVTLTNGSTFPLQNGSLEFSNNKEGLATATMEFMVEDFRYKVDHKRTIPAPGVTVTVNDTLPTMHATDVAAGLVSAQTATFSMPPLPPAQSSTNKVAYEGKEIRKTLTINLRTQVGDTIYDIDLSSYFHTGDKPTQAQFASVIDSTTGATPTGGPTTLLGVTADGTATLASSSASGIDSSITTLTAGAHLYIGGHMVDVAPDGHTSGNAPAGKASMSANGRYVIFESSATNLLTGVADTNGATDIFVRDMMLETTYCVSAYTDGLGVLTTGNGSSFDPQISWDGRTVIFRSSATNLVPGLADTNDEPDLYSVVADGDSPIRYGWSFGASAVMRCVSVVEGTNQTANKGVKAADIDRDGNTDGYLIGYFTEATNTVLGAPPTPHLLTKVNKVESITIKQKVSMAAWTTSNTFDLTVSMDGSTVVFWTDASVTNLLGGATDTNGVSDVLRLGVANGGIECVSLNHQGTATGDGPSPAHAGERVAISLDGDRLAFTSTSSNLIPGFVSPATDGVYRVFKSKSGTPIMFDDTKRMDSTSSGYGADNHSPSLSADGLSAVWTSSTNYQSTGSANGKLHVWFRDINANISDWNAMLVSGTATDQFALSGESVTSALLSSNGQQVAFSSAATDLIGSDTNGQQDVFLSNAHRSQRFYLQPGQSAAVTLTYDDVSDAIVLVDSATSTIYQKMDPPTKGETRIYLYGHTGSGIDTITIDYAALKYKLQSGFIYATQPSSTPKLIFNGGFGIDDEMEVSVSVTPGTAMSPPSNTVELKGSWTQVSGPSSFSTRAGASVFVVNAGEIEDKSRAGSGRYLDLSGHGTGTGLSLSGTADALVFTQSQGAGSPPIVYKKHHGDYLPAHNFKIEIDGVIQGDLSGLPSTVPPVLEIRGGQLITLTGMNGGAILDGSQSFDPNGFTGAGNDTIILGVSGGMYQSTHGKWKTFRGGGLATSGVALNDQIVDGSGQIDLDATYAGHRVVINLDSTTPQPYMPGRTLQVNAPITTMTGTPFDDDFTAKALAVPRYVDGGSNVTSGGDQLHIDALGQAATVLVDADQHRPPRVLFRNSPPVTFENIEQLFVTNQATTLQVVHVEINDGAIQRSRVDKLRLHFNTTAQFMNDNPPEAFVLTNTTTGQNVPFSATAETHFGFTVVKFTFPSGAPNYGSLSDGAYSLTLLASKVSSPLGNLDGDGDGVVTPGENYVSPPTLIHRIFGDSNGDRITNLADFAAFRGAFNLGPHAAFDFDNDGNVGLGDFAEFRSRFNLFV